MDWFAREHSESGRLEKVGLQMAKVAPAPGFAVESPAVVAQRRCPDSGGPDLANKTRGLRPGSFLIPRCGDSLNLTPPRAP